MAAAPDSAATSVAAPAAGDATDASGGTASETESAAADIRTSSSSTVASPPVEFTTPTASVEGSTLRIEGTLPADAAAAYVTEFSLFAIALGFDLVDETTVSEDAEVPSEIPTDFVDAVFFASGSDQLDAASLELLDAISAYLVSGSADLRIVSHTDASGSESENLHLAQHRAGEVFQYLLAQGVPAERVSVDARGEVEASGSSGPDAENERRVEFVFSVDF